MKPSGLTPHFLIESFPNSSKIRTSNSNSLASSSKTSACFFKIFLEFSLKCHVRDFGWTLRTSFQTWKQKILFYQEFSRLTILLLKYFWAYLIADSAMLIITIPSAVECSIHSPLTPLDDTTNWIVASYQRLSPNTEDPCPVRVEYPLTINSFSLAEIFTVSET